MPAFEFFQQLAITDPKPESWISTRLREELPGLLAEQNPALASGRGPCYVSEAGDFVNHVLHILAKFTQTLVHSEEFVGHLKSRAVDLAEEADLEEIAALDERHLALKCVLGYRRRIRAETKLLVDLW